MNVVSGNREGRGWGWVVGLGAGLVLILTCFGSVLFEGRQFAFRDCSHFYYPLYQKVRSEWAAGRLPLWAPEQNAGMPLLGHPAAAVLYPGQLVHAALPYPWAVRVYTIGHVLLAVLTMRWLLRRWGVSPTGANLAGLAYGFGGPVLTQYSNVIFLVGAAWLPLGWGLAEAWVRTGRTANLVGLALVLALQVLGGDPEAAYLTVLAASGLAAGVGWAKLPVGRRRTVALVVELALIMVYGGLLALEARNVPTFRPALGWNSGVIHRAGWGLVLLILVRIWWGLRDTPSTARSLLGLGLAGVLALLVTGVQLVPTLEFIAQTGRVASAAAHNNYAWSVHPLRVVEALWPNFLGVPFGRNRFWVSGLPPDRDSQIWMTTLFMGGLTTILAVVAILTRSTGPDPSRALRRWMVGVILIGGLGSLGSYASPVFWARTTLGGPSFLGEREAPGSPLPRPDGRIRDGDSSPYWFLSATLPGFATFRYPGKLMIPVAAALAVLAGFGWDAVTTRRRRWVEWVIAAGGFVGLAVGVSTFSHRVAWMTMLGHRIPLGSSLFGPFDPVAALAGVRWSLLQGSAVLVAGLAVVSLARRSPRVAGGLALAVLAVDLGVANQPHVGTVPQAAYEVPSGLMAAIHAAEAADPSGPRPFRIFRTTSWNTGEMALTTSPDRLETLVRWDRETLQSQTGLTVPFDATYLEGTAEVVAYANFFQPSVGTLDPEVARSLGLRADQNVNLYDRRGFDLWNTRYFILPTRMVWDHDIRGFASFLPQSRSIYPDPALFVGPNREARLDAWERTSDVQILRNDAAYPRAWVVHEVRVFDPATRSGRVDPATIHDELVRQADEFHPDPGPVFDPHRVAWVEGPADQVRALDALRTAPRPDRSETVQVTYPNPTRTVLDLTTRAAGLVVLADLFYPGWTLEIDGQPAEILRVNRVMRGAVVPAGRHQLVYQYRPIAVPLGVAISVLGLLGCVTLLVLGRGDKESKLPGQDSNLEKQDQNLL